MNSETATETVSETRKGGRPRVFSEGLEAFMRPAGMFDGCASRHGVTNRWYQHRAFEVLFMPDGGSLDPERQERFRWLLDPEKERAGVPRAVRTTLLQELGRFADDGVMLEAADVLCETKPKTKAGVAWLRRVRLGTPPRGDALQLANELITALNGYRARYPETTREDMLAALAMVGEQVSR